MPKKLKNKKWNKNKRRYQKKRVAIKSHVENLQLGLSSKMENYQKLNWPRKKFKIQKLSQKEKSKLHRKVMKKDPTKSKK